MLIEDTNTDIFLRDKRKNIKNKNNIFKDSVFDTNDAIIDQCKRSKNLPKLFFNYFSNKFTDINKQFYNNKLQKNIDLIITNHAIKILSLKNLLISNPEQYIKQFVPKKFIEKYIMKDEMLFECYNIHYSRLLSNSSGREKANMAIIISFIYNIFYYTLFLFREKFFEEKIDNSVILPLILVYFYQIGLIGEEYFEDLTLKELEKFIKSIIHVCGEKVFVIEKGIFKKSNIKICDFKHIKEGLRYIGENDKEEMIKLLKAIINKYVLVDTSSGRKRRQSSKAFTEGMLM